MVIYLHIIPAENLNPSLSQAVSSNLPGQTDTRTSVASISSDTSTNTTAARTGAPLSSTGTSCTASAPPSQSTSWTSGKPDLFVNFPSNYDLVRRHSVSLSNRTPPPGSLAADLMQPGQAFSRTQLIVDDLKDLTDRLSDFNSCVSSSECDDADIEGGSPSKPWTTMNEQKRMRRNKRRHSLTPNKESFMKKLNAAADVAH